MAKVYVIPVDMHGTAFFGVKALTNPYNGRTPYCAGCPNVFGGNIDNNATVDETLYKEARQESRCKIDLDQFVMLRCLNGDGENFRQIHTSVENNVEMTFYLLKEDFIFDEDPRVPNVVLSKPEFNETTGDIIRLNLRAAQFATAQAAAQAAIDAMPDRLKNLITPRQRDDFLTSHSAEAIRLASELA